MSTDGQPSLPVPILFSLLQKVAFPAQASWVRLLLGYHREIAIPWDCSTSERPPHVHAYHTGLGTSAHWGLLCQYLPQAGTWQSRPIGKEGRVKNVPTNTEKLRKGPAPPRILLPVIRVLRRMRVIPGTGLCPPGVHLQGAEKWQAHNRSSEKAAPFWCVVYLIFMQVKTCYEKCDKVNRMGDTMCFINWYREACLGQGVGLILIFMFGSKSKPRIDSCSWRWAWKRLRCYAESAGFTLVLGFSTPPPLICFLSQGGNSVS